MALKESQPVFIIPFDENGNFIYLFRSLFETNFKMTEVRSEINTGMREP